MKLLLRTLFVFAVITLIFACGSKGVKKDVVKDENSNPREDQFMVRSHVDTAAILYLVNDYLTKLKDNKIDSAMAMLYEADGDTVVPASSKKKAEILKNLKAFPVLNFHLDELYMFSEKDTEVRYTIEFFEKSADDPRPNTIKNVINPRRVGYYWYLTIPERKVESNYKEDEKLREKELQNRIEENLKKE